MKIWDGMLSGKFCPVDFYVRRNGMKIWTEIMRIIGKKKERIGIELPG